VYNFIMKFLAVNHPPLMENDRSTPWYVEHGIANGHPSDRVIRVLQFLAVGHGYICQFCGLPCQCVNMYMEGGNVRIFGA